MHFPPFETGHTQSTYTLQRQCFVTKGFVRRVFLHHKQFRRNNSDVLFSFWCRYLPVLPGLFLIVIIPWKVPRVIFVCLCFSCDIKGNHQSQTYNRNKRICSCPALQLITANSTYHHRRRHLSLALSLSFSLSVSLSLPLSLSLSLLFLSAVASMGLINHTEGYGLCVHLASQTRTHTHTCTDSQSHIHTHTHTPYNKTAIA